MRVVFVDNFDSFTYNLVDELAARGAEVVVYRNDVPPEVMREALVGAHGLLVSPGPGRPERAGGCLAAIEWALEARMPMLGVCLGHQALVVACGGAIGPAPSIVHGRASPIVHDGAGLFAGLDTPLSVGRYHSLTVTRVPACLRVTATLGASERAARQGSAGAVVMAVAHLTAPAWGVQFHPESVLTPRGGRLIENFLAACEPRSARYASA